MSDISLGKSQRTESLSEISLEAPKSGDLGKDQKVGKTVVARPDSKLSGRKVSVQPGPGKLAKIWNGIKAVGKGLGALVGGTVVAAGVITLGVVALAKSILTLPFSAIGHAIDKWQDGKVGQGEKAFIETTPWVQDLKKGMPNGILTTDQALMGRMTDYAKAIRSPLTPDQIKDLVNTGERLVSALKHGQPNLDGSIDVTVDGKTHNVKSSTYTTLAISWYLMAKAGHDGDGHLVERGAMMMKDDGNKLHDFLSRAPTAYGRVSTHLGERSTSAWDRGGFAKVGVFGSVMKLLGKTPQRGIEDFQGRFPGQKSCILFDKTQDDNGQKGIYIKFESAGMPNVYRLTSNHGSHGDKYDTFWTKQGNKLKAFARCVQHSCNFVKSRGGHAKGVKAWIHRENINKDEPKAKVFKPYQNLLGMLEPTDQGSRKSVSQMEKAGKKFGLYMIEQTVSGLVSNGRMDLPPTLRLKQGVSEQQFMDAIRTLQNGIDDFRRTMGDDYGVDRKGSEVHVNLDDVPQHERQVQNQNQDQVQVEDRGNVQNQNDAPPVDREQQVIDEGVRRIRQETRQELEAFTWLAPLLDRLTDDDLDELSAKDGTDLRDEAVRILEGKGLNTYGGVRQTLQTPIGVRTHLDKLTLDELETISNIEGETAQRAKARELLETNHSVDNI